MNKEAAIRHCIACCDGALTDEQRCELSSRIGGAIEAARQQCVRGIGGMLRSTLSQALRQWRMYAEMAHDRDLNTEDSPEAEMYRAALALTLEQ